MVRLYTVFGVVKQKPGFGSQRRGIPPNGTEGDALQEFGMVVRLSHSPTKSDYIMASLFTQISETESPPYMSAL